MTKPDRLPSGDSTDIWRDVLSGKKFPVGHGWYVTKQPSQVERGQFPDHAGARALENSFFKSQEPWASRFASFNDRFGTFNLQKALSQKLASLILTFLPLIRARVNHRLTVLDMELKELPEPPKTNALLIVNNHLRMFKDRVQKDMDGEHPYNEWRLLWKEQRLELYEALLGQLPKMIRLTTFDVGLFKGPGTKDDAIMIDSDEELDAPEPRETPMATPVKKRKTMHHTIPSSPFIAGTPSRQTGPKQKANGKSSSSMCMLVTLKDT